jgi:hypothetical protein
MTNARIAGFTFLAYIVFGVASMILFGQAVRGEGTVAKLASIAQHAFQLRVTILLGLVQAVCAFVLAVTLYRITRDQDEDLALLAMVFRVAEDLLGAAAPRRTLELLWLATASGTSVPGVSATQALGTWLLEEPSANLSAIFFAMGSTLFSYLLLRGRTIPVALAWVGVFASVLLVISLPLQLAGFVSGALTWLMWMPMLAFEVPLGLWLIVKGTCSQPQPSSMTPTGARPKMTTSQRQ